MQVIDSPNNAQVSQPQGQKQLSPREKAIAALNKSMIANAQASEAPKGPQLRELPVQNPNAVDPMEMAQLNQANNSEAPEAQAAPEEESKAPSPKEDPVLSSQYAALARREKALRAKAMQQEQSLKAREDALKAKEAELSARSSSPSFDPSKYVSREELRRDPFAILANENLTYEQLTEMAMNAPKPEQVAYQNEMAALKAELKALKDEQANTRKSIEERESEGYKAAVNQIRFDVKSLVNKDPAFETIKVTGQAEEVVKLIESVYKEGMGDDYPKGTLLDVYEAAKMVEDEVAENLYKWSSQASKVKSRFQQAPASSAPAPKSATSQPSSNGQMKTLTNQMNASRQLSARDRAILAGKGQLGK